MTGDRVQREAELLAQAVVHRRAARAQARGVLGEGSSPTGAGGAEHRGDTDPGATGWADLLAGAALAARGGLDLVGGAVTRWVDATGGRDGPLGRRRRTIMRTSACPRSGLTTASSAARSLSRTRMLRLR